MQAQIEQKGFEMSDKGFKEARADLQEACSASYPVIHRQVEGHCNTFIWQMDKGLEKSLSGIPIEQVGNARLTADKVRRISRETGKKYSHACLAITPKFLSLSSSIESLADGRLTIQQELNAFRAIVERLAVLEVTYTRASDAVDFSTFKSFEDLVEVVEVISSLIGTRFDWSRFQSVEFADMPVRTDYIHNADETRVDFSAKSILGNIDKLQKRESYRGIRPFYNFCCEFVHPNIGDNIANTANKRILITDGGQLAYKTKFSKNPILLSESDSDFFIMFSKGYCFAKILVNEAERIAIEFGKILDKIKRVNQRCAHKVVKNKRLVFRKMIFARADRGESFAYARSSKCGHGLLLFKRSRGMCPSDRRKTFQSIGLRDAVDGQPRLFCTVLPGRAGSIR